VSPEIALELRSKVVMAVLARYEERWGARRGATSLVVRTLFESCAFDAGGGSPKATWTTRSLRTMLRNAQEPISEKTLARILQRLNERLLALHDLNLDVFITVDDREYAVSIAGPRAVDRGDKRGETFLSATVPRYIGPRVGDRRRVINAVDGAARSTTNPLPPQVSTYIAEEDVIATILNVMAAHPRDRIGIAGLPGSGKTELAKDLARRLCTSLQRDAIFVTVGHRQATEVTQELVALSAAYFGEDRGAVIVLDGAHDTRIFDRWVEPEACTVIVTARQTLPIVGCRWFLKRGVAPDIARMLLRATSMRADVGSDDRAWSYDPTILPSGSASAYEWRIARYSGWMPAAIAEAGAYLAANPHRSASDFYFNLDDQWEWTPRRPQETPLWRDPVEVLVRQSMSELTEQCQCTFGRLAVFKSWFTHRAANFVTEGYEDDLIPILISRGLLDYDEVTDALRVPFFVKNFLEEFIQMQPIEWRKANLLRAMFFESRFRQMRYPFLRDECAQTFSLMHEDVAGALDWTMQNAPADKHATDLLLALCDLLLPDAMLPKVIDDATRQTIISDLYQRFVPPSGKPRTVKIAAKVCQLQIPS
jgi:hypothetical protein